LDEHDGDDDVVGAVSSLLSLGEVDDDCVLFCDFCGNGSVRERHRFGTKKQFHVDYIRLLESRLWILLDPTQKPVENRNTLDHKVIVQFYHPLPSLLLCDLHTQALTKQSHCYMYLISWMSEDGDVESETEPILYGPRGLWHGDYVCVRGGQRL